MQRVPPTYYDESNFAILRLMVGNIDWSYRFKGQLDVAVLERALAYVVERHESLQWVYRCEGDELRKYRDPDNLRTRVIDVSHLATAARDRAIAEFTHELDAAAVVSGAVHVGVARVDADEHVCCFYVPHMIFDGISCEIFDRDLGIAYTAMIAGDVPRLAPLGQPISSHDQRLRGSLGSPETDAHVAYWRGYLEAAVDLEGQPAATSPGWSPKYRPFEALEIPADPATSASLQARNRGISTVVTFTAFAVALQVMTGREDITVVTATDRRAWIGADVIGCLIGFSPVRTRFTRQTSVLDLYAQIRRGLSGAHAHGAIPIVPPLYRSAPNFFNVELNITPTEWDPLQLPGIEVSHYPSESFGDEEPKDFAFNVDSNFNGFLHYSEPFTGRAHELARVFPGILSAITRSTGATVGQLLDAADERGST